MKDLTNLINKRTAGKLAGVMQVLCIVYILLLTAGVGLVCMGKLEYALRTNDGYYPRALYSNEVQSEKGVGGGPAISLEDDIYITTSSPDGKISLTTHICLVVMHSLHILTIIYTMTLVFNVLDNIKRGDIFIKENANYLMHYTIIRLSLVFIYPFVKLLFVEIVNIFLIYDNISLSTGQGMLSDFMPSIGFLLAVYIINNGVNLQDEVDSIV